MSVASGVEVRPATVEDWAALREVRLRALADAPDAFGSTLAQVADRPEEEWRAALRRPWPLLLAHADGRPVAMGGLGAPDGSPDVHVWGMWVAPEARGSGVGSRILADLLTRARATGRRVVLDVTDGNDGARRLYERHGFAGTGARRPLRDGSALLVEEMVLVGGGEPAGGPADPTG